MSDLFGFTRNVVNRQYALMTPSGFVPSSVPGWSNAQCIVTISEALGANFCQMLITLQPEGQGRGNTRGSVIFAYVLEGSGFVSIEQKKSSLVKGSYIYIAPESDYSFASAEGSTVKLVWFQKRYELLRGAGSPELLIKQESQVTGLPTMGNAAVRMQELLPATAGFDMAVNIVTSEPGATLPMVETHIMERGVLMLEGQGLCRLGNDWHPVRAGDVMWTAPYCPQWFVAIGKTPASYIFYKNVNREPLRM